MLENTRRKTALLALSFLALVAMTTASYVYFVKYQPKVLRKIEEVKGIKKVSAIELLYPENVEKISFSQTTEGTQVSYRIFKPQEYIQTFYKNLLLDMGWEEESIIKSETSLIYKFKIKGKVATIITQKEPDATLVSVEIAKR
jgi:hypothetical protein